ncbi:unnamed protein product, partial [Ixodes pacificus]
MPGLGAGRVCPKGGRDGAGAAALALATLAELACRPGLPPPPDTSTEEACKEKRAGACCCCWGTSGGALGPTVTPCWAMMSDRSRSGSWTSPVISSCACFVASAEPLGEMVRSPWPLCFSTSMCAPEASRMALMLQPQRPMTRLMALDGTVTFLERRTTSFQPSSPRW